MSWAWVRDRCYTLARGWEMQPSEFLTLTLHDFWLEFDMRVRSSKRLEEISSGGGVGGKDEAIERAREQHRAKKAARKKSQEAAA